MLRRPILLLVTLTLLAAGCGEDDTQDSQADASAPDSEITPDAGDASGDAASEPTWGISLQADEADEDARLLVQATRIDAEAGTFTVRVKTGQLERIFGLSLRLSYDPELLALTEVTRTTPAEVEAGRWGFVTRALDGAVVAGLALLRSHDPIFNEAPVEATLEAGTRLLELDFRVLSAGTSRLSLAHTDTLGITAADDLVRIKSAGMTVTTREGGSNE